MTTPWPALLRLAALRFAIPPDAFWRLSLAEWRALTGESEAEVLGRGAFEALAQTYPD